MSTHMTPEYQRAYRKRRKAQGRPVRSGSKTRDPIKNAAWEKHYYSLPRVRKLRADRMKKYVRDPKHRHKHEARWKLRRAVVAGRIKRQPCEKCMNPKTHGHHDDYSKPLEVRWLCHKHHMELHRKAREPK